MLKSAHSMDPIIADDAEIIILGSMPGVVSLSKGQYFAHPRNHFWPIIYSVFGAPLSHDYSERVAFIKAHRIALWDVIGSCKRVGSSDSSIKEIEVNDIEGLLQRYPTIRLIILNGSKADTTYQRYLKVKKIGVRAVKAPSTSPVPGRNVKTFDEKLAVWKQMIESVDKSSHR